MKKEAVLHIPMSNYAFAVDINTLVFRIRTAKNDFVEVNFCFGDTACRKNPIDITKVKMEKKYSDDVFDYYEVTLVNIYNRVVYYFELVEEYRLTYYYADFFYDEVTSERNELYKFPYNRKEDIADVPSWFKSAVVYNIFPDSFATSYRYISLLPTKKTYIDGNICKGKLGGTIKGISDNLDYIKEMGFDVIYLNPIFVAGEYHKYDLIDYMHVDPVFGTDDEFLSLVNKIHYLGMKIIIDGVFNHSGWNFAPFLDVIEKGKKSPYVNWFYHLNFPVIKPTGGEIPNYECFGYEKIMPKLNTSNKKTIDYFMKVASHWVKNFGVDGWRLDVADEVNTAFWRSFRNAVKSANKDALLIGEVWQKSSFWLDGSMFDSTMNYDFLKFCKQFFAFGKLSSNQFNDRVVDLLTRYRKNLTYGQLNLLDSHDVPRFLSLCEENEDKFIMAVVFQMTFVGVPSVFYGDEIGFTGIKEDEYRRPMEFNKNSTIKEVYKNLIKIRKQHACVALGEFKSVESHSDDGLYIYKRYNKQEEILVILNNSSQMYNIPKEYQKYVTIFSTEGNGDIVRPFGSRILKK